MALYSTESGKNIALSYSLSDERAKGVRKEFDFEALEFHPENGEETRLESFRQGARSIR